jgi:D-amino-acid oxidase
MHVHVLGSGIIGLGVAIRFAQGGHQVRVFSSEKKYVPTSPVAAAFWYPYACSMTEKEQEVLASPTYDFLVALTDPHLPSSGVEIREGREYFDKSVSAIQKRAPWWARHIRGFRSLDKRDLADHLTKVDVFGSPFVSGWSFQIPVVNMGVFLPWLRDRATLLGVQFEELEVGKSKSDRFAEIRGADVIINCSGGWSTHLASDPTLVGYKGVILEVEGEPFGSDLVFIEKGVGKGLPTYIVPQGSRTLLGGTLEGVTDAGSEWPFSDSDVWRIEREQIDGILGRVASLVGRQEPSVVFQARCGLRPCREASPPRIELDRDVDVIHCYGHGGSGVTTFWGSAEAVYRIATKTLISETVRHSAALG